MAAFCCGSPSSIDRLLPNGPVICAALVVSFNGAQVYPPSLLSNVITEQRRRICITQFPEHTYKSPEADLNTLTGSLLDTNYFTVLGVCRNNQQLKGVYYEIIYSASVV